MSQSGKVVSGKFELLEPIGGGGMGRVYGARHLILDQPVAVKLLPADKTNDEIARARFLREARAAAKVRHPHVCEVYDVGEDDGVPFYVMPLLSGQPLSTAIARDGPFSIERATRIGGQILDALDAAHRAGVIHRDLKPSNVFLARVGEDESFVKILDFGISKIVEPLPTGSALTHTGAVLGTPHYMAPEQARGRRDIDHRVDLYAAGAILYEMLTGRRPIDGENANEVLWQLWNEPVTPPRALRPDLSLRLEAVILHAMDRDPNRRYASAADLRCALLDIDREPKPAPPPEETHPAVAVPPTPVTDGAFEPPPATTQTAEPPSPSIRARPRRLWLAAGLTVVLAAGLAAGARIFGSEGQPPAETAPALAERDEPPASLSRVRTSDDAPNEPLGDVTAPNEPLGDVTAPQTEPRPVPVTLVGLPRGAVVTVDDERVSPPSFDLIPRAEPYQVTVRARGYRSWRRPVRVSGPLEQRVRMQRVEAGALPEPVATPEPTLGDALEGTIPDFGTMP